MRLPIIAETLAIAERLPAHCLAAKDTAATIRAALAASHGADIANPAARRVAIVRWRAMVKLGVRFGVVSDDVAAEVDSTPEGVAVRFDHDGIGRAYRVRDNGRNSLPVYRASGEVHVARTGRLYAFEIVRAAHSRNVTLWLAGRLVPIDQLADVREAVRSAYRALFPRRLYKLRQRVEIAARDIDKLAETAAAYWRAKAEELQTAITACDGVGQSIIDQIAAFERDVSDVVLRTRPTLRQAFKIAPWVAGSGDYPATAILAWTYKASRRPLASGKQLTARQAYAIACEQTGSPMFPQARVISYTRQPVRSFRETPRVYIENVNSARDGLRLPYEGEAFQCDEFGDSVFRAVVVQLPGKNRAPRYLAGCRFECGGDHGVTVDIGRGDVFDDLEDAKRAACGIAEREAEKEGEYQAEANAAFQFGELGAQVAEIRRTALQTAAMWRKLREPVRSTFRSGIESELLEAREEIARLRKERDDLAERFDHTTGWKDHLSA